VDEQQIQKGRIALGKPSTGRSTAIRADVGGRMSSRSGGVSPRSPIAELVGVSLRTRLSHLTEADLELRRQQDDAVHQMRVACRHLRSDLRTFAELLDDPRANPLRDELGWLAGALGDARDLEVLRVRVARLQQRDPLHPLDAAGLAEVHRRLTEQEQEALAMAREALESSRYAELLQLASAVAARPGLAAAATQPCRDILPSIVGAAWQHLAKRARRLTITDPDSDWHRARILAKRARYAAESAAVALGTKASVTAAAATTLQDILGEHQDAVVAADRLLSLGISAPPHSTLAATCGRLAERELSGAVTTRAAFPDVWRAAKGGRTTRWLSR
jgi:CHAD domain-containing protein